MPHPSLRVSASIAPVLGLLVMCVFATSPAVLASPAATTPWEESAGLRCVVSDSIDAAAQLYESPDYQHTLVVPGGGETAFILALSPRTVRAIPKASVTWSDAGPTLDPTAGVEAGAFMEDQGTMSFPDGDYTIVIEPEPPLVGALTLDALQEAKPDYAYAASRYQPDAKAVATLHSVAQEIRLSVFFGAWCSHCKRWVPRLLSTLKAAENPKITTEFFAMDEDLAEPAEAIGRVGVSKTPTIVVYRGGVELGRIEEEPLVSIEADLASILSPRKP